MNFFRAGLLGWYNLVFVLAGTMTFLPATILAQSSIQGVDMKAVSIGGHIPDFSLADQSGKAVSSKDLIGKKNLVIYFYPKDETPGCTAEACAFRDQYEEFKSANAEVIGISADSVTSHKKFSSGRELPFILLSDPENVVRKSFGVPSSFLGLMPGRVTYVVDKEGVVRHIFNSQLNATKHVQEALRILKTLD